MSRQEKQEAIIKKTEQAIDQCLQNITDMLSAINNDLIPTTTNDYKAKKDERTSN